MWLTWDDIWDMVLTLAFVLLLCCTPGCAHCQTFYRFDGGATERPYYRIDICRTWDGKATSTLVCESANRLPNDTCK